MGNHMNKIALFSMAVSAGIPVWIVFKHWYYEICKMLFMASGFTENGAELASAISCTFTVLSTAGLILVRSISGHWPWEGGNG